jgi:8-oxo-dGTP diphosphatase
MGISLTPWLYCITSILDRLLADGGNMKRYVVGFAFDRFENSVALILKARPDWQKGRFNGIGGHIEEGEMSDQAMSREWAEETQADDVDWTLFAHLKGTGFEVFFFRGNTEFRDLECYSEGEEIEIVESGRLPENVISNLRWLIPMAKTTSAHDWPYEITEQAIVIEDPPKGEDKKA